MSFDSAPAAESKPPVSRDPEVVRERILDAAQAEFMEVGYAAANTNRIARQFNISKATIFRHFASKAELFESVVERIAERWRDGIAVSAIAEPEPRGWLIAFAGAALQRILAGEVLFVGRMAIGEGMQHSEVRNLWPKLATRPIHAALTGRLAAWQAEGRVRSGDTDRLATAFLDLTLSGVVSRALYGSGPEMDEARIERHVIDCVDLFLSGCGVAHVDPSGRR